MGEPDAVHRPERGPSGGSFPGEEGRIAYLSAGRAVRFRCSERPPEFQNPPYGDVAESSRSMALSTLSCQPPFPKADTRLTGKRSLNAAHSTR